MQQKYLFISFHLFWQFLEVQNGKNKNVLGFFLKFTIVKGQRQLFNAFHAHWSFKFRQIFEGVFSKSIAYRKNHWTNTRLKRTSILHAESKCSNENLKKVEKSWICHLHDQRNAKKKKVVFETERDSWKSPFIGVKTCLFSRKSVLFDSTRVFTGSFWLLCSKHMVIIILICEDRVEWSCWIRRFSNLVPPFKFLGCIGFWEDQNILSGFYVSCVVN